MDASLKHLVTPADDRHPSPSAAKPLAGKRIAVTRARAQAGELAGALRALGAEVIEIPTIEIRDPQSWESLDHAIRRLNEFSFLLVTSVNGAERFLKRLRALGRDVNDLKRLQVGAIGPATAAELERNGVRVDFVPKEYRAEGLLEALSDRDLRGASVLIPRAKVARDLVPRALKERGAHVEVVEAYQTVVPDLSPSELRRLLTPPPHLVTFTSSSTASNFAALLERSGMADGLSGVAIASIGPVTSDTVRKLGLKVSVEARESTISGLLEAIRQYLSGRP